ncbi:hypothetical protein BJX64DRAFT_150259 [Aspergillus heterothallicus]
MPQNTQQPPEHKESLLDRLRHHHHHNEDKTESQDMSKPAEHQGGLREDLKKDEEDFKQYMKKDEELEEEGDTYGGLM